MKHILIIMIIVSAAFVSAYAVDSTKPSTHNNYWLYKHGQAAKANEAECLMCHEERVECIECHEDMPPRSHTSTFVNRTHGLESRWKKISCQTCHREDFCTACHETAFPKSHMKQNFKGGTNTHCGISCQLPVGTWTNTVSKNCIVCHHTRPQLQSGGLHSIR